MAERVIHIRPDGFWESGDDLDGPWEDLRFPASGLNPAGAVAPASVDNATGCLLFSGTADNQLGGIAQMPHGWHPGSAVRPHIHLIAPTSAAGANSRWKFEHNVASVNGLFPSAYGSFSTLGTITVANPASAAKHVIASFPELAMTGHLGSACIIWRLSRLAASDVLDNDTSDWALMEFDLHYRHSRPGTPAEYPSAEF